MYAVRVHSFPQLFNVIEVLNIAGIQDAGTGLESSYLDAISLANKEHQLENVLHQ